MSRDGYDAAACPLAPAIQFEAEHRARRLRLRVGMYPFSVPTEPVRAAIAELNFADPGGAVRRWPARRAGHIADWRRSTNRGVTDFAHGQTVRTADRHPLLSSDVGDRRRRARRHADPE